MGKITPFPATLHNVKLHDHNCAFSTLHFQVNSKHPDEHYYTMNRSKKYCDVYAISNYKPKIVMVGQALNVVSCNKIKLNFTNQDIALFFTLIFTFTLANLHHSANKSDVLCRFMVSVLCSLTNLQLYTVLMNIVGKLQFSFQKGLLKDSAGRKMVPIKDIAKSPQHNSLWCIHEDHPFDPHP